MCKTGKKKLMNLFGYTEDMKKKNYGLIVAGTKEKK